MRAEIDYGNYAAQLPVTQVPRSQKPRPPVGRTSAILNCRDRDGHLLILENCNDADLRQNIQN